MGFAATAQIPVELKPYVTLITSDQPEFSVLVGQLLTPQQQADYAAVIPYGVFVQNVSSAPLRGYGIAFVQQPAPAPNGRLNTYNAVDNAITPLGLFQAGQSVFYMPGVRLAPPALQPGQTGATGGRVSLAGASSGGAGMAAVAQQLAAYSSITASVEYVVTEAGKILGPDRFQDAKNVQASEQALADLSSRIKSHGNDMAGLTADLHALAQTKVTDRYTSTLHSSARMLYMSVTKGADPAGSVKNFLRGPGSGIVISR